MYYYVILKKLKNINFWTLSLKIKIYTVQCTNVLLVYNSAMQYIINWSIYNKYAWYNYVVLYRHPISY